MESEQLEPKLKAILEAIAAGRTCEEILAADHTLSYRDIFHAVAEAPTSFWDKATEGKTGKGLTRQVEPLPRPIRHRTD